MKRKEYIQPELAMVEVELQRMIANSPGNVSLDPNGTPISDESEIGSREDGFFGF